MSEVLRSCMCPVCELEFLIKFDRAEELLEEPVRIDCPRPPSGTAHSPGAPAPRCHGYITTQLPARYRVLAE